MKDWILKVVIFNPTPSSSLLFFNKKKHENMHVSAFNAFIRLHISFLMIMNNIKCDKMLLPEWKMHIERNGKQKATKLNIYLGVNGVNEFKWPDTSWVSASADRIFEM